MSLLINDTFTSDVSGWTTDSGSGLTWVNSEDALMGTGYASLAANSQVTRSFTAVTSGSMRVSFWFRDDSTTTAADNSANLNFYALPTSGSASSANSAAYLALNLNSGSGATSTTVLWSYRNSAGAQTGSPNIRRDGSIWRKVTWVINVTNRTYDIYFDDQLLYRDVACANTSFTDVSRFVIISGSASPAILIDEVQVEGGYTDPWTTVVDHDFTTGSTGEIETLTPTTASNVDSAQPWLIPATTYGAFTVGANGAAPDASNVCLALQECDRDCYLEAEFKTSVSGVRYIAIVFRLWDYPSASGAGGGIVRISSSDGNCILQLPDASGTLTTISAVTTARAMTANTVVSLRVEPIGRTIRVKYKEAALDSGSWTTLFTHTVTDSASGGRGMMSETMAGPMVATTVGATDNYVRRFRCIAGTDSTRVARTVGDVRRVFRGHYLSEQYVPSSVAPTRNLVWSKRMQSGHRSRADAARAKRHVVLYDVSNSLLAFRYRGNCWSEYECLGHADLYFTVTRRGVWISDHVYVQGTTENIAPDDDFRGDMWSLSYRSCKRTGSATSTTQGFADWANIEGTNVSLTTPGWGYQNLTAYGSGVQLRSTEVVEALSGLTGSVWGMSTKYEGTGDPRSCVGYVNGSDLTNATSFRWHRGYLEQVGSLSQDGTVLTDWRGDVIAPATLTMTTGSLKTDAAGDTNNDGFNERHGWYEVTCSGGLANFTLPVASGTRHMPQFFLRSHTLGSAPALSIAGTPGVLNTDYTWDDLGGGLGLLQVLSSLTSNTSLDLSTYRPWIHRMMRDAA